MGGKQLGFSDYAQTTDKKRTNKERFLAKMDQVAPWQPLLNLIQPVYPKVSSKVAFSSIQR
jgi:transposase, IS5 family